MTVAEWGTPDALVLVIDDDADVRSVVELTLQLAGFDVATAPDGESGISEALRLRPDVVLLDLMMPDTDGYQVTRRLRGDARLSHIPIIMLTAKAQMTDKVTGLDFGADDYVTKPFDTDELIARVHATLRRARDTRSVSPLTGLPGNVRIEREIAQRVDSGANFALLYADLDRFKAYNDRYGFLRGDQAIRTLGGILQEVAATYGDPTTFVGHVGGDDFVLVTGPEEAEASAAAIVEHFDEVVPSLYDDEDRAAGYVVLTDRQGQEQRHPLMSVSIGIVSNAKRSFHDHRQMVQVATDMKNYAKRTGADRSGYAIDRRTGDGGEGPQVAER